MNKTTGIFFTVLILFLTGCSGKKNIEEALQNEYESISFSTNYESPSVNFEENHLKEILVLLHYNYSPEKIKEHFNIKDSVYALRINELFGEGLIKKSNNGNFIPTCMIIDFENGKEIKKTADSLGYEMAKLLINRIGQIKNLCKELSLFKALSFEEASLYMLSNVMYNFWQMKYVEERFIKALPPKRGIARYYLAIIEKKKKDNKNPFELYVNNFRNIGRYVLNSYGEEQMSTNFNLSEKEIEREIRNRKENFPFIDSQSQKKIENITAVITQNLLDFLEANRTLFIKLYLNSAYKDQTSFREWFFWLYQFMIAKATKSLIEEGYIQKQSFENSYCVILK